MNKSEIKQRVLQNGKPLSKKLFTWDESTRTFSSSEDNLVIDFSGVDGCTFNTGINCTFKTGGYCIFNTGHDCTFKTGSHCTFDTGSHCTFDTGNYCILNTGSTCTFKTGLDCVVVRRDVFDVIVSQDNKGLNIKLNGYGIKGYTSLIKHVITIDGKDVELSQDSFNALKESLIGDLT